MSNTIQIKRSSTAASVPTAGQLAVGELAVNLADRKLFTKNASNVVVPVTNAPDGGFSFRNRIINGDMRIDQRNAGASVTPTASVYTVDRWQVALNQSSKFSVQQNAGSVTPPAGFTNYLGATSLSAYAVASGDILTLRQQIEGYNIADLAWGTANAKTITLSFWVRSSLTGTFGGAINNVNIDRSYPFSYTISSANTWTQISVTIAGDTTGTWNTTNSVGMYVQFSLGGGTSSSATAGAWTSGYYGSATGAVSVVGTSGATFYITGVQLEAGSVATPFERRPYGTELQLCQRYTYAPAPGSAWIAYMYASGAGAQFVIPFPVTMRVTPTFTLVGTGENFSAQVSNPAVSSVSYIASNSSASQALVDLQIAANAGNTSGKAVFGAYQYPIFASEL
jgi:hypothetical protein